MFIVILIIAISLIVLILWCIVSASTTWDRDISDEAQMKSIREWKK